MRGGGIIRCLVLFMPWDLDLVRSCVSWLGVLVHGLWQYRH